MVVPPENVSPAASFRKEVVELPFPSGVGRYHATRETVMITDNTARRPDDKAGAAEDLDLGKRDTAARPDAPKTAVPNREHREVPLPPGHRDS